VIEGFIFPVVGLFFVIEGFISAAKESTLYGKKSFNSKGKIYQLVENVIPRKAGIYTSEK
jgi:hypothetical protein